MEDDFQFSPNGDIKLTLTYSHREFLKFLGERGEVYMNWEEIKPQARDHMRKLFDMGLLHEIPVVGVGHRVIIRFTDMGRNILTMIHQREKSLC